MTHSDSDPWRIVLAAAGTARVDRPAAGTAYKLDGAVLRQVEKHNESALLMFDRGWHSLLAPHDPRHSQLQPYLSLASVASDSPLVIAQLGQSLDGFIATANGDSHYVTGNASIRHLHRLRALSDCVIVGAGTVAADNPRLTTRLVTGASPVRVILDPNLRLPLTHHVFNDAAAATIRVRTRGVMLPPRLSSAQIEDIEVASLAGRMDLVALLGALRSRAFHSILVEGGGFTVSAFLAAGLLDRLQIVVAPFLIGEGRPGVRIPSANALRDCRRPGTGIYALGNDVLFDCDLRNEAAPGESSQTIGRLTPAMP